MRPALLLIALALAGNAAGDDLTPVREWIAQQREVRRIEADFTQTKALRTLRSPVVAHGKFWFRAPASFRWQVGDPARLVVLGNATETLSIQPAKRTAERTPFTKLEAAATARGFDFLKFPLAADFDDFQRKFEVLAVKTTAGRCHLELLPRDADVRRFLTKIALDFDVASGHLLGFEVTTREGSSLRTEFTNPRVNAPIDPATFAFDLSGYQVRDAK